MVADTSDWASISGQPTANVAVTNVPGVNVNNTPGVNVNNTPAVTGSGTFNTSNTDANQPNIGKSILTASIVATLTMGQVATVISGVANQVIRLLTVEIIWQETSTGAACKLEDTTGALIVSFPNVQTTAIVLDLHNAPLAVGVGLQVHNASGVPFTMHPTVNARYTQA